MCKNLFKRRNWKVDLLVEGEKSARLVSRLEHLPDVNPEYDVYPVDIKLPKKRTFKEAVNKVIEYSRAGIYSMIYKDK